MITDAQVHIWTVDPAAPKPENPQDHQLKHPNGHTAADLIASMDAAGVDRAVVCPPSSMMQNAGAYARESAAKYPGRIGIMDQFNPTGPDAKDRLAKLKGEPHILGIRLGLRGPGAAWLDDGSLDWLWADCERLGMPVTTLVGPGSGKLLPVAKKHPGLTITIDHMGRVPDVKGDAAFGGIDALLTLASCPRVGVKMTSVPDSSAEPYPYKDLYNGVKRIYEGFGGHRMLWGSDLSGLSVPYSDCLKHFQEGLDFISKDDKEWILGKTAATMYGWPEA